MIQEIIDLHYNSHYDMRKFSFYSRIIPIWNSFPDYVVAFPTINTFKARLDKFWENQDVRYNCKADISFTRSCSKVEFTIDKFILIFTVRLSQFLLRNAYA